jgi:hypothetical protein
MTAHLAASDHAEQAGRYAARATVADVSLNIDVLKLILNDGPGRASLMARSRQAMLTMVAHHEPAVVSWLVMRHVERNKPSPFWYFNQFMKKPFNLNSSVPAVCP